MRPRSRGFYQLHIIRNGSVNLNHLLCRPFFSHLMSSDTVTTVHYSKSARPLTPHRGVIASALCPLCLRVQRDFAGSEFHSINVITEVFFPPFSTTKQFPLQALKQITGISSKTKSKTNRKALPQNRFGNYLLISKVAPKGLSQGNNNAFLIRSLRYKWMRFSLFFDVANEGDVK